MTRTNVLLLLVLMLLVACSQELTSEQQAYKEFCLENDGSWMKMSEMKDGSPTGRTCHGCMPDEKNHLCTRAEYEAVL